MQTRKNSTRVITFQVTTQLLAYHLFLSFLNIFFLFFFNTRLKFLNATRTYVDYDSMSSNGMA